jgi:CRP-like cAMP-binding protein
VAGDRAIVSSDATTGPSANRLLVALSTGAWARLRESVELVGLDRGQSLAGVGETMPAAYFPVGAVIALVARVGRDSSLEVGLLGREGVAGICLLLGVEAVPVETICRVAGPAWRMPADVLRAAAGDDGSFRAAVLRYAQCLTGQAQRVAACTAHHAVGTRLARWLLMTQDRAGATLPATHHLLAGALGVRRPSVSIAATALQQAGLIRYHRGAVTVLDRAGLELTACGCYAAIRAEETRLLE